MKHISILCPTRGRPERFAAMVASALQTATNPERVEIRARVGADDEALPRYQALQLPNTYLMVLRHYTSYAAAIEALREFAFGEILFCGADDVLFRTEGWDTMVEQAFDAVPDGLQVFYSNDGRDRQKCEFIFTTRRWVEVVGYLMWPEFEHFCCDQWVEELAQRVGRLGWLREVVTEHMHKKFGKAPDDATYQLVRGTSGVNQRDNDLFARRGPERAAAVERLRAALA